MREVRFRLRDRHNKIVGYEKWYCGKFRKDEGEGFHPDSGYWEADPCWLYSKDGEKWNPTPINHRFKDQYMELQDKNKKEIFEGDILLEKHKEGNDLGQVTWLQGGFELVGTNNVTGLAAQVIWGNYEIIGNKWEHPELLK